MYEFFDHTADLGFRIIAESWAQLLIEAAECLYAAMLDDPTRIREQQVDSFEIVGTDPEYLLFDWLRELLMRTEIDGIVYHRFAITITEQGLHGQAWGEPLDLTRHELSHEVKAITYHGLSVAETPTGWMAEVIVDI